MSAFKLVLDIGLQAIPGVGKILDAGLGKYSRAPVYLMGLCSSPSFTSSASLGFRANISNTDAATTAAQLISYAYPPEQDPVGAFEWWLSPCGGSDFVPDDIKHVFDILSTVANGVSSFQTPKNIRKGSGKKGDAANPTDRSKPKAGTGSGPNGTGGSGVRKRRKCKIPAGKSTYLLGQSKNTLREQECVAVPGVIGVSTTSKHHYVITGVEFGPTPTTVTMECEERFSQACYHYSSAIEHNPAWGAIKCPHGKVKCPWESRPGPRAWEAQHDKTWRMSNGRPYQGQCEIEEFPPRYLLSDQSPEMIKAGKSGGQLMRYIPQPDNYGAGQLWKGFCFKPYIKEFDTPAKFKAAWNTSPLSKRKISVNPGEVNEEVEIPVPVVPYFAMSFEHSRTPYIPPFDDGLWANGCWPHGRAPNDPGFALWSWDPWYERNAPKPKWNFGNPYNQGSNGS